MAEHAQSRCFDQNLQRCTVASSLWRLQLSWPGQRCFVAEGHVHCGRQNFSIFISIRVGNDSTPLRSTPRKFRFACQAVAQVSSISSNRLRPFGTRTESTAMSAMALDRNRPISIRISRIHVDHAICCLDLVVLLVEYYVHSCCGGQGVSRKAQIFYWRGGEYRVCRAAPASVRANASLLSIP